MQKNSSACTHSTLPACPQWPFLYAFVQKNMMHFCLHNKSIPIKLCQTIQHMMIFCHLHPKHHLHLYSESFLFVCLFSTVMTSPGPALQECPGSCHENVPAPKAVSSDLRSTDGLTVFAWIEIVAILVHYQPSYNTSHTMKPNDPLLLADVTLRCGMYPADKVDIS